MDTYVEYKNDLKKWYHELDTYGITLEERKVLEPVLLPLYGVADSQEAAMQLAMNPNISNFSLTEANALRRAIARKDPIVLQETKQLYYEKGQEAGTSKQLLDYVWNVQIRRQEGYSFSLLHTMAYSYIAIQQMNTFIDTQAYIGKLLVYQLMRSDKRRRLLQLSRPRNY